MVIWNGGYGALMGRGCYNGKDGSVYWRYGMVMCKVAMDGGVESWYAMVI